MKIFKIFVAIVCVLTLTICYAPKINTTYAQESLSVEQSLSDGEQVIPASYNSNYNDLDYITPAKNQGSFGMCWAFSAIACAEADAVKNHSASADLDLSEWHLTYFAYQGERAGTGDSVSPAEGIKYYEVGGFDYLSACVLSSWVGLADEEIAPFSTLEADSNAVLPQESIDDCSYYIKNVLMYDIKTQPNIVKNAIMEYGAVAISYNASNSYLSSNYAQYCSNTSVLPNHEVVVVGWDDNYSKNNFRFMNRPSSNGAWLVKNSWGSDWGLNGYFWLSYEDVTIGGGTAFDVVPTDEYDYNYQHDGGVSQSYMDNVTYCAPVANAFTANGDEVIKSVGVTTVDGSGDAKFDDDGIPYNLKIYVNPTSMPTGSAGFEFTNLVHEQDGVLLAQGFSSLDLTSPVYLRQGDKFVAVIDTDAYVACDTTTELKAMNASGQLITLAYSSATSSVGQSYYTNSSGVWRDAGAKASYPFNVRIKVFTSSVQKGVPTVSSNPTITAIYYGQRISDIVISGGVVLDSVTSFTIDGVWSVSEVNSLPDNGSKLELIFTPYDSEYSPISINVNAVVLSVTPTLIIDGFTQQITAGEQLDFTYQLANEYNPSLSVLGEVLVYYKIGDGDLLLLDGTTFVAPETDEDLTITFIFEYAGIADKYNSVTKEITITVLPKEVDEPIVTPPTVDDTEDDFDDNLGNSSGDVDNNVNDGEVVDNGNNSSGGAVMINCAMAISIIDGAVVLLPLFITALIVVIKRKLA